MFNNVYIIDWENQHNLSVIPYRHGDSIWICHTAEIKLTTDVIIDLQQKGCELRFIKCHKLAKQALDTQIDFILGMLFAADYGKNYIIVSSDKGYSSVLAMVETLHGEAFLLDKGQLFDCHNQVIAKIEALNEVNELEESREIPAPKYCTENRVIRGVFETPTVESLLTGVIKSKKIAEINLMIQNGVSPENIIKKMKLLYGGNPTQQKKVIAALNELFATEKRIRA